MWIQLLRATSHCFTLFIKFIALREKCIYSERNPDRSFSLTLLLDINTNQLAAFFVVLNLRKCTVQQFREREWGQGRLGFRRGVRSSRILPRIRTRSSSVQPDHQVTDAPPGKAQAAESLTEKIKPPLQLKTPRPRSHLVKRIKC